MERPRSMPPPAGPRARPRDPAEEKLLSDLRHAIRLKIEAQRAGEIPALKTKAYRAERRKLYAALWRLLGTRSLSSVARRSGLSLAGVSRILRGERVPLVTHFRQLARALEIDGGTLYRYLETVWKEPLVGGPVGPHGPR